MKYLIAVCILLLLAACDGGECNNTNPVFDKYAAYEQPYRTEIIRQLRDSRNYPISYWIQAYIHSNSKDSNEYIMVHCKGKHLCGNALMRMQTWERLEHVKQSDAKGYHGAGLVGLRYTIDDTAKVLVYTDVEYISD